MDDRGKRKLNKGVCGNSALDIINLINQEWCADAKQSKTVYFFRKSHCNTIDVN